MSQEFQLKPSAPAPAAQPPFQVLCLSGGGYRGLYTAALLEELEAEARKPLAEVFDLIAGTSIGGILAIALASGIKAATLRETFENRGRDIFPRTVKIRGISVFPRVRKGVLVSRYNVDGLRAAVSEILGGAPGITTVQDITKTEILVTSVDVTNRQPKFFGIDASLASTPLIDAALATSAAPTYFPEHRFGTSNFVDGGLIANAPDTAALVYALRKAEKQDIKMLSLGTVGESGGEAAREPSNLGWLLQGKKLADLTLAVQEQLSIDLASNLLIKNYIRLDVTPSGEQRKAIGLDRTDKKATDTLKSLAAQMVAEGLQAHEQELRAMLNRTSRRSRT